MVTRLIKKHSTGEIESINVMYRAMMSISTYIHHYHNLSKSTWSIYLTRWCVFVNILVILQITLKHSFFYFVESRPIIKGNIFGKFINVK